MSNVVIVDYGMCNLDSIARAVEECGGNPTVTDQPRELSNATQIILPGVGAFPDGMRNIRERGLESALNDEVIGNKIPFLGICLGMQLMANSGEEVEPTKGLGWINGDVVKLKAKGDDTRIPHIGWNVLEKTWDVPILEGIEEDRDFYFVHSYHIKVNNEDQIAAYTPYAGKFVSSVCHDHIFGTQFHPEKSQKVGFQVLKNFLKY